MPAATPARHASTLASPPARGKSKLLTVALAFVFGSLGAHRFYLRERMDISCFHFQYDL